MSAASPEDRTRLALLRAADLGRLQLLLHASANGHVAPRDAVRTTPLSKRSGTNQYHITELVRAGLLERESHGRYVLTQAGTMIVRLYTTLARGATGRTDDIEIDIWNPPSALDELVPAVLRLDVELQARLPTNGYAVRVSKST